MLVLRKLSLACPLLSRKKFFNFLRHFKKISDDARKPLTTLLSEKTEKFLVHCVDENGEKSKHYVPKSTLYHNFGLSIRDLRFNHPNMLFVRNQKIVMRFQDLKILVCADGVLLIDPPFDEQTSQDDDGIAQFWQTLPTLMTGSVLYTSNLPLEYRALEAIFMHIMWDFSRSLAKLQPEINELLNNLTDPSQLNIDRSLVHVLLKYNTRLNRFSTQLSEFCSALQEILDDEETIRKFCISTDVEGGSRSQLDAYVFSPVEENSEDSLENFELRFPGLVQHKYKINLQDEMENLLDTFLRDAEEISNIVKELKESIDNSSTAILINLDSYRNSLLRFELELTIGMFSCTLFGLIGMAFGMNLESSFEENSIAFWLAAGIMVGGSGILWRYLLIVSRKPLPQNSELLKRIISGSDSFKPSDPPNPPHCGKSTTENSDGLDTKKSSSSFLSNKLSTALHQNIVWEESLSASENLPRSTKAKEFLKKRKRFSNIRHALDTRKMKSLNEGIGVTKLLRGY